MKDHKIYLIHIRDCFKLIKEYTEEGKDSFFQDSKTQNAVIRILEVMIESIKQLPQEWLADYPDIPWSRVIDFRNQLAHEYLIVDLEVVWEVVTIFLPPLESAIESIANHYYAMCN